MRVVRLGVALALGALSCAFLAPPAAAVQTTVGIAGTKFTINGASTYPATSVEGLLLNTRLVQAVFDDENELTASKWAYPDTGVWDPGRNTNEFVAALPSYAAKGMNALTINLQGGNPVTGAGVDNASWAVSAFNADGSLKTAWMLRAAQAIEACDANGIVVILGLFYQGQDQRLTDEAAVIRGLDNVVDWILARGFTNVLLEINNESRDDKYQHAILRPSRVHELIARAQQRSQGLLKVSTSFLGGALPPAAVIRQSDFVLLHGNGQTPSGIASLVDRTRAGTAYSAAPKPLLFNEDDRIETSSSLDNMDTAIGRRAGWGFHYGGLNDYATGFQHPPVNWTINDAKKRLFFDHVASLATTPGATDETAPAVTSVSPAEGATGVLANANLSVTFSEPMNRSSAQGAFSLLRAGSSSPLGGSFSWSGNVMTFNPSSDLSKNAEYTARVTRAARDAAGNALAAERAWSFQTVRTFTAYPSAATIQTGSLRAGSASRLNSDDNSYYQVNSTSSGTRTSAWYGVFSSVPNALSRLSLSYKGKNSRSCTQTLTLWRWRDGTRVTLDTRSVGTSEVLITKSASGTLADYVSGSEGPGNLHLRVLCTTSAGSFYASGDLMRIVYDAP